MKPAFARHRTDRGSQALIELLKACGVNYEPLGSTIDGVAWVEGRGTALVDWKASETAPLTTRQHDLVKRGCPVRFIWTREQVLALALELKRAQAQA